MRSLSIAVLVGSLVALPARGESAIASGRYAHMHMKLEKTFLRIDAVRVDIWVDEVTRDRFGELAGGQHYSDGLAERIARTVMEAEDVLVQVEFLRNVSLAEFLKAARDNLEDARDAGYISQATFTTAWQGVRTDFARLAERGLKKGDRLIYRAVPQTLRTTVRSGDRVLVDVTTRDDGARRSMLASYFAPGTDFRKGLIRDLLR